MAKQVSEFREPPHRKQKRPLPLSAPVIAEAQRRRQAWILAMRSVSQSTLTEHDRETRQGEALDNHDLQE
jgi:hypothetical protein